MNGKYYFGVHKTKDPYDGYLGSGKLLKRALKKYGEPAFLKNVCFIFDNPDEAFAKEFELIQTYRLDPMCYNLRQGGSGGFDYINREGQVDYKNRAKQANVRIREKRLTNPDFNSKWLADHSRKITAMQAKAKEPAVVERMKLAVRKAWLGHTHSDDTKKRMRLAAQKRIGQLNSQYATCWVTDGNQVSKVKGDDLQTYLNQGWRRGRK